MKLVPVIVAITPLPPRVGLTDFTFGKNENWLLGDVVLVPPLLVTETSQISEFGGELSWGAKVVIVVSLTTVNTGCNAPQNLTESVSVKEVPVMVTSVPTIPLLGETKTTFG